MIPLWAIKAGAGLALMAGVWFHGRHIGAVGVQARWDAQVRADKDAADAAREADRLRSHAAATKYEVQRAAIAARSTTPTPEYRDALHAPICPVAGPLELGDVPLGAAVLQRLRDASADY